MEILELKSTINEIKNSLERFFWAGTTKKSATW